MGFVSVLLIRPGHQATTFSTLSPVNQNVLSSRHHSGRPFSEIVITAAIENVNQSNFVVVALAIGICPGENRLVGIRAGQPGSVHYHQDKQSRPRLLDLDPEER